MVFLIGFLSCSALSLLALTLLLWRAPRGWQDDNGFHLGTEPPTVTAPPAKRRAARKAAARPQSEFELN